MMTMRSLETARLIVRPFSGDDLQAIHQILDVELAERNPFGPIIDDLVLVWSGSDREEWENQVIFLPMR